MITLLFNMPNQYIMTLIFTLFMMFFMFQWGYHKSEGWGIFSVIFIAVVAIFGSIMAIAAYDTYETMGGWMLVLTCCVYSGISCLYGYFTRKHVNARNDYDSNPQVGTTALVLLTLGSLAMIALLEYASGLIF